MSGSPWQHVYGTGRTAVRTAIVGGHTYTAWPLPTGGWLIDRDDKPGWSQVPPSGSWQDVRRAVEDQPKEVPGASV